MRLYLDHNATAPPSDAVADAVREALLAGGNPSSVHASGRAARARLEAARRVLAARLDCKPQEIVFTSGGTEANGWAVAGAPAERLIVSAVEHDSVLAPARAAAQATGRPLTIVAVDDQGRVRLDRLEEALAAGAGPALVSIQTANNEVGTLQPVAEVRRLVHAAGALLHLDATQSLGKQPLHFDADLMTLSAHKIGGPAGVGALVVREGLALAPLLSGGGQELRRRAGTENLSGIMGFSAALENLDARLAAQAELAALRDGLQAELTALAPGLRVFADTAPRLANTLAFALPGLPAETQLMHLDLAGVEVGSGSACSSGKVSPSHVLAAMGVPQALSGCALRLSFGPGQGPADAQRFLAAYRPLIDRKAA